MRISEVKRNTREVSIKVKLNIDGKGFYKIKTGNEFLNHILSSLSKHSLFDLEIEASGDLKHHIAEDVALTFGDALDRALGDKKGITRLVKITGNKLIEFNLSKNENFSQYFQT